MTNPDPSAGDAQEQPARSRRSVLALAVSGLALELLYLFAWKPVASRFVPNIEPQQYPFVLFFLLWIASFLIYFAAIRFVRRTGRSRIALSLVILFAVVFRLTIRQAPPILDNDIYRYLWDGMVTANGQNPFRFSPEEVARFHDWEGLHRPTGDLTRDAICRLPTEEIAGLLESNELSPQDTTCLVKLQGLSRHERVALAEMARLWDAERYGDRLLAINYAHVPTIYPPFAQAVFAMACRIKPMSLSAVKDVLIAVDLLTVALIALLLRRLKLAPSLCVIYAWSPLVVKEFADSGHCDVIAIACVVAAVLAVLHGRHLLASVALALGFLTKMFPLLLLPVIWRRIRRRGALAFAVVVVAAYIPFLTLGVSAPFQGLRAYADRWEFNSGLFTLCEKGLAERLMRAPYTTLDLIVARGGEESFAISKEINPFLATKTGIGVVFLLILCLILRRKEAEDVDLVRKAFLLLGALLLLSPVANAWYFCWLLPFLCVFPKRSWLALTCLLVFAYAYYVPNSAAQDGPVWSRYIEPIVSRIPLGPRADTELWSQLPAPERSLQLLQWWRTYGIRFVEYVPFFFLLIGEGFASWRSARQDCGGADRSPALSS